MLKTVYRPEVLAGCYLLCQLYPSPGSKRQGRDTVWTRYQNPVSGRRANDSKLGLVTSLQDGSVMKDLIMTKSACDSVTFCLACCDLHYDSLGLHAYVPIDCHRGYR